MTTDITVIAHNIRSAHNVGSLLRTCEGLGISKVYLTGYTPYPMHANDERLPHLAAKIDRQIHKTALGAESLIAWEHQAELLPIIEQLKEKGLQLVALEQSARSVSLPGFTPSKRIALILGNEVEGVDKALLELMDTVLEIPMSGKKESFNVVEAASMTLYHLRFML
jgi:23S rRNA (guanosine2251-2'-O)-methyltransferase